MQGRRFSIVAFALVITFVAAPGLWAQNMNDPDAANGDGPNLGDLLPLARSILYPDMEVVSARPLVATGVSDKSLRDALDLEVSVLSLKNGHQELQTRFSSRPNTIEEIAIRPDLENDTYTLTVTPLDREALEKMGLWETFGEGRGANGVPQKIFGGGAICRDVLVGARDHTGSASVIRSTTLAGLKWRWYSDDGLLCLDVLQRRQGCDPAHRMNQVGCSQIGTNDGRFHATQKILGGYQGTPPGSPALTIFSTAEVRATGFRGTVATSSVILPSSEPNLHIGLVSDTIIPCPQPHI